MIDFPTGRSNAGTMPMHAVRTFPTAAALASLCLTACAQDPVPGPDAGDLRMGVVGQDGGGLFYRLRDAVFDIQGPTSTAVGTEEGPTTDVISVELSAGQYDVLLEDGWRLERFDPISEAALDVEATLVSDNPASVLVTGSETSSVVFVFEVPDAGPVVLGDGDLEIDIDVNVGASLTPCDPLVQDCPGGDGCYPTATDFVCAAPIDPAPLYGDCDFVNTCLPGQACLNATANLSCNQASVGCCLAYCSVSAPVCGSGETCASLGIGDADVGVCATL